jgi:hypothetical protein
VGLPPFNDEEWLAVIMELKLTLDFACCLCDEPVHVTVQCKGKGFGSEDAQALAAVNIPCPSCGQINQLFFAPCGTVRSVRPYAFPWPQVLPSVN